MLILNILVEGLAFRLDWVLVKGFNLSYHNMQTRLFTIDPYYGSLNPKPLELPL